MQLRTSSLFPYALLLLAVLPLAAAQAKDYIIEVVLFENLFPADTISAPVLYVPRSGRALALGSSEATEASFTAVEEGLLLSENAESIRQSGAYRLLDHFAWRQPGLDAENAQPVRITIGNGFKVFIPQDYQIYPDFIPATQSPSLSGGEREVSSIVLNGTLKVRLGRFLHLDTKLVYTDTETATSFRMNHSRKMRSRELHYIDNPRFGLLVKIVPVPET